MLTRAVVVGLGICAVSCGGKSKGTTSLGSSESSPGQLVIPKVDASLCDAKGKRVQTYDINDDGQPDVWKLYAESDEGGTTTEWLTCKQVDFDHDGKMDYVVLYRSNGEVIAKEFDYTFDGKFDSREHYDKASGRIFLVERDGNHDKDPDIWEKRDTEGNLESVRMDRNGDGKPDMWEQYERGELIAILYDDNYDNRVDRRVMRKVTAPQPVVPPTSPRPGPSDEPQDAPGDGPADESQ